AAVAHGLQLATAGADILDVGGESTRPFADPVAAEEEWRRVGEVIRRLAAESRLPVSIDTSKPVVAEQAIAAGAEIINDVTGLEGDPAMAELAQATGVGVCAMHMQGTPQTMQLEPRYDNVVAEIHDYLRQRRDALLAAGIAPAAICLDPGIGFGKTHQHNLQLMQRAGHFLDLGCPILVGHSRKGFLGKLMSQLHDHEPTLIERDLATAATACSLAAQGIQIIRIHDVASARIALTTFLATFTAAEVPVKPLPPEQPPRTA
ncbi:MAG: dihydropteroate synthase, partial [Planctomycetia bacterium]|nr:dihydropteroate synthase [Planctomycetia bacterium]